MDHIWYWFAYSFLGYCLEKLFAAATRSSHRLRRCFVFLPLCPVYGLALLAVLALPPDMTGSFWRLALYGGLTATAVEYAVHFLYERLLGVDHDLAFVAELRRDACGNLFQCFQSLRLQ